MIEPKYFECSCLNCSHVLRFIPDSDYEWISIEVYFSKKSFFRRVWTALKYIFHPRKHIAAIGDTLLERETVYGLTEFLTKWIIRNDAKQTT